jgi:hypothetical protein
VADIRFTDDTGRIVCRVDGDAIGICEVWAVGARTDAAVNADAVVRVRAAAAQRPALVALAEIMDRLGPLSDGIEIAAPPAEPLPVDRAGVGGPGRRRPSDARAVSAGGSEFFFSDDPDAPGNLFFGEY